MIGKIPTLFTDDASPTVGLLLTVVLALAVILVALAVFVHLFAFTIGVLHPTFVLIGLALIVLWLLDRL